MALKLAPSAVEEGAGGVHRLGDGDDVALEQAAGVGVGQHDRRDVGRQALLHLLRIDGAVGAGRNVDDLVAEERGGRRVGAVGGFRHEHDRALVAARLQRRLDRHHAAELAVRAGLGAHRDRRHAGHLEQPAAELGDQLERAGHGRDRLQRMDVAEARQPRHLLVEARVVLHRARAERIDAGVDGVVLLAEAHVVAHRLRLGEAGEIDRRFAGVGAEARFRAGYVRQIDAGDVDAADLEQQRLLDLEAAVAGEGFLRRARFGAAGDVGRPWSFSITAPPSAPARRRRGRRRC